MTYAILAAGVWIVSIALLLGTFSTIVRRSDRQHARERELLLNQLMHLSGKTWAPPPSLVWNEPEEEAEIYEVTPLAPLDT